MRITKRIVAAGTAGVLGLGAVGTALVVAPVVAVAATPEEGAAGQGSTEPGLVDRLQSIKDALAGLVTDGTITQEQADAVAETLESSEALRHGRHHGPGGRGGFGGRGGADLAAAAEVLGTSAEELHTALHEGTSLAAIAGERGVAVDELVDALVAASTERIEQAVTEGRLPREQADEKIAALPERVAAAVERVHRQRSDEQPTADGETATPQTSGTSWRTT
ncbi:hypothetical protein CLV92_1019 [Kineococcus xinjiangensis]|uniref:Uncharacterized protein n=1 Tax=Kineococcus xinjiangensis TaxID=512762 RepID=A0A2S6IVE3_9ACTN|nr:hypothetical protein [Kineococcus xinjiangensis]PPK98318.1 hypothetical protein CLV92_1019 [Kineococcus xinjiangensis]